MVSERELTPEKQLLGLIEKPKSSKAAVRKGLSLFSFGAFKGRLSFFVKNIRNLSTFKGEVVDIKGINSVLRFCVFVLAAYFATTFTVSALNLKKAPVVEVETKVSTQDETIKTPSPLKKLSFYVENIGERDIFSLIEKEEESDGVLGQAWKSNKKIAEAAKNLKLVGISWSRDPDAMIEDAGLGRVFIVKKGENIGIIKIEAIFKDKVVLGYEGEELELK
ncbi:hypothetical protein ACFL28_01805 [Candidatus Omnitrophota bacterium]